MLFYIRLFMYIVVEFEVKVAIINMFIGIDIIYVCLKRMWEARYSLNDLKALMSQTHSNAPNGKKKQS